MVGSRMNLKWTWDPTHKELVTRVVNCKVCMRLIHKHIASELGKIKSHKKAKASRVNGKLGGRPKSK